MKSKKFDTPDYFVEQSVSEVTQATNKAYRKYAKRLLDIAILVLLAPIAVPMIAVFALIILIKDGGLPFYTQMRVGRGGKEFRMWKLRTMVANADAHLATYLNENPDAKIEWDQHQKLARDPRITKFGQFLRKSSMDELPQLFNVLIGDMSLVGPRPMMVDQKSLYHGKAYYRMRPGMTGPWQISDRHKSCFADRVNFDNNYEMNLSLRNDVSILSRTFAVVIDGDGV